MAAPGISRRRPGLANIIRRPALLFSSVIALVVILVALFGGSLTSVSPTMQDYGATLQPPSAEHPFGTDSLGRDVLSRTLHGTRTSLLAALLAVGVATIIGLPVGVVSGYIGGWWDELVVMRLIDGLQAFPFLILAMSVVAALGPGLTNAMLAIGIGLAPAFTRVVRSAAVQLREQEFTEAAGALGASRLRTILVHVIPNCMPILIVQIAVSIGIVIIAEASLSFLGLGAQPPIPSWGSELRAAQGYMTFAPWLAVWPGLAICVTVLAFNLLGDELRSLLDPKSRKA